MRKGLAVVVTAILLIITYSVPVAILENKEAERVTFYTEGNNNDKSVYMFDNIYMTECSYSEYKSVHSELVNIVGVSFIKRGDYDDYLDMIERCRVAVLSYETVGGIHTVYGISELCGQTREVDGKNVNIQIAISGNVITVGTPLIMGSY